MLKRLGKQYQIGAKNFIHTEAQKRLYEVVHAAQDISTHSVFVHATAITYFAQICSENKCSCTQKLVLDQMLPNAPPGSAENFIDIDATTPLFGKISAGTLALESRDPQRYDDEPNSLQLTTNSLFGNATNCPVCYRVGTLPGLQPIGYLKTVLTTSNILRSEGYYIDSSSSVSSVCSDRVDSVVEYLLDIPYVYTQVFWKVLNLDQPLEVALWLDGAVIDYATLYAHRGETVTLQIVGITFTHIVFNFKLNNKILLADFPQDVKPTDFSTFDTTQSVQIVMDKSIPSLQNGDIIYKHEYNTFWKVTDFDYLRMKTQEVIGWNLSARLIQKDEVYQTLLLEI